MMVDTALSPYLTVSSAKDAIAFYVAAFGAQERFRLVDPADGRIGHAEISLGGVTLMLSDEYPDFGALTAETIGGSPVKFLIYVDDCDAAFAKAVAQGAAEVRPVKDQFFGDRQGTVIDPFGHSWTLSAKIEEVNPLEMQARWDQAMAG
jgi:PhnB protein